MCDTPRDQRKPRVLVVDDEADIVAQLEHRFAYNDAPFARQYAMTGTGAIELVQKICFDLALLDIDLPDLTGGGTAYQLHKIDPNLPIVLFSSHGAEVAAPIIAAVPGTTYLDKFEWLTKKTPESLIAKIAELAGGRRCDEEIHGTEGGHRSHDRTVPRSLPLPDELETGARAFLAARGML